MTLPLPNLDDRTYAELVEEARALIPGLYPEWTHHNPADPGITLIELFAWLTEMLIYRVNRLSEEHVRTFLRLLNEPDWLETGDLEEDIGKTVLSLRERHRTVTCEDYEVLARQAADGIARVKCVPRRDLSPENQVPEKDCPGHVTVILVPDRNHDVADLIEKVEKDLELRRLLTTRNHVMGPLYARVSAEILVARQHAVPADDLKEQIVREIQQFLDPLAGGPSRNGWPFGRAVYVSELYELLEGIPGIDYVPEIALSSSCVNAEEIWHPHEGDLMWLHLPDYHLPWADINVNQIFTSVRFVEVRLEIVVKAVKGKTAGEVQWAVKQAVRELFHPLRDGPKGTKAWEITLDTIHTKVHGLEEVVAVNSVTVHELPARIQIEVGELADVRVIVELTDSKQGRTDGKT